MEKTVNILGTEYRIEHLKRYEDSMLNSGEADGYCDSTSKRIVLRIKDEKDNSDDYSVYLKKLTRHEIIHAFLFESGLAHSSEWATNEELVDWIAFQAEKIIKAWQDAGALKE